jgi:hypothetical protein
MLDEARNVIAHDLREEIEGVDLEIDTSHHVIVTLKFERLLGCEIAAD